MSTTLSAFHPQDYFDPTTPLAEAEAEFINLFSDKLTLLSAACTPTGDGFTLLGDLADQATPCANQCHNLGMRALQMDEPEFALAEAAFALSIRCRMRTPAPMPPSERATLLMALRHWARALRELGDYPSAIAVLRHVVSQWATQSEAETAEELDSWNDLASLLLDIWQLPEAITLLHQVVARNTQVRPAAGNDPNTLIAQSNLADALKMSGDLAGARALCEQVLRARQQHPALGPEHPDTLTSMNNLADVLRAQGDIVAARSLLEQMLAVRQRLQPEHPDTLTGQANLACILYDFGQWREAAALERRVLAARMALGPEHPDTLSAANNLAGSLRELGEFAEARQLLQQVLAARQLSLGLAHNETLTAMTNLADMLREAGALYQAKALAVNAWRTRKKLLSAKHPDTLNAATCLAAILHENGEVDDAIRFQREVVAGYARLDPTFQHLQTLGCSNDLASMLRKTGQAEPIAEAHALYSQVNQIMSVRFADGFHERHTARLNLAETHYAQNQRAAAWDTLQPVLTHLAGLEIFSQREFELAFRAASLYFMLREDDALHQFLQQASRAMITTIELLDWGSAQHLLEHFRGLHEIWLRLCLAHYLRDLPLALTPLHGIEASAALRLDPARTSLPASAPSAQEDSFNVARRALADIRMNLQQMHENLRSNDQAAELEADLQSDLPPEQALAQAEWQTESQAQQGAQLQARLHQTQLAERAALAQYRATRAALLQSPAPLPASLFAPACTMAHSQASLGTHEVLLLLVHLADGFSVACVIKPSSAELIALPGMAALVQAHQHYLMHGQNGWRRTLLRRHEVDDCQQNQQNQPAALDVSLEQLIKQAQRHWWQPLAAALAGAGLISIVCAPSLRQICLDLGNPGYACAYYPGMNGWLARMRRVPVTLADQIQSDTKLALDAAYDSAWQTDTPLPFAKAEVALLGALWPPTRIEPGKQMLARLENGSHQRALHIACHGMTVGTQAGEHAVLLLDSADELMLDPGQIAAMPGQLDEFFCSTCVGGLVSQRVGTDAIGIISALQNKGVRSVIACFASVPDFYMPLLAAFYWHARIAGEMPVAALALAKRQLLSGAWPHGLLAEIARSYGVAIETMLWNARVGSGSAASWAIAQNMRHYLLPPGLQGEVLQEGATVADWRQFSAAWCEREERRAEFARAVVGYLLEVRAALPPGQREMVRHLCGFTVCFGL